MEWKVNPYELRQRDGIVWEGMNLEGLFKLRHCLFLFFLLLFVVNNDSQMNRKCFIARYS